LEDVLTVVFFVVSLVPAIVLHEVSHGVVADRMGDHTARFAGRLTLNPIKHVDPFGTVVLPGLLLLPYLFGRGGNPIFGYAKPMPVNPSNLRDPDRQTMWIALAGPLTNLVMAGIAGLALRLVAPELGRVVALIGSDFNLIGTAFGLLAEFLLIFLLINILLGVFNIMPIPPLDGSKVLARFLPPRARHVYQSLEPYGALFMLAIFFLFPGAIFAIVDPIRDGLLDLLVG
jgi:Zn-dependent protease